MASPSSAATLASRLLGEPYIPVEAAQARMLVAISVGSDQSWQGVRWIG